jgi:hypothetical protein
MLATLLEILIILLMLAIALVMEIAIQTCVTFRWFKNLALSLIE